jgi:nicotinamidase-related amidase
MKRLFFLFAAILVLHFSTVAQQSDKPLKTALLIVDIQNFYFPGDGPGLVNADSAGRCAQEIMGIFRNRKQLVVHIGHKAAKGGEFHKYVSPLPGEKVIIKEEVNSFQNTGLLTYLKENSITRLVIIGMQTHLCLEAATRAAKDFGFECIVVGDACATKDLTFGNRVIKAEDVQASTLATISRNYGLVVDLAAFRENPEKYLFQPLK